MRDDSDRWQAAESCLEGFTADAVRVAPVRVGRQTMISGPVAKALRAVGLARAHGWPELASAPDYALRLRRDRLLAVGGAALSEGWDAAEGLAITDMSHGLHVLEITGKKAFSLIRTGTEISRGEASASVLRLFAGHAVMLYCHGDEARFRLHVSAPEAPALMTFLRRAAGG